jgi:lysine decarboxylase
VVTGAAYAVEPVVDLSPRGAFFAATATVPTDDAVGRVSAELVAPYPPGVPVLAPGERVTDQVLAALAAARGAGVRIAYAADPTLATLRVVV